MKLKGGWFGVVVPLTVLGLAAGRVLGVLTGAGELGAVGALAQTQQDILSYPEYADSFAAFGLTWEPVKVETSDGYILTMFHITGTVDGPIPQTGPSVIMQHGMGGTASGYMYASPIS